MKKRIVMTAHEAQEYYRVTNQTLIAWSKANKIETFRTIGGWRRYVIYEDVPDEEMPSKEDVQAESEARKKEIEAKLAELKEAVEKDATTLLARHADSFAIPQLEKELKELS